MNGRKKTIHVIEGELTATVDDVKHVLRAGSTILLQRNIAHRLHNSGDQTCRYILLATPAGFDDFVADAGEIWEEKKGRNAYKRRRDSATLEGGATSRNHNSRFQVSRGIDEYHGLKLK